MLSEAIMILSTSLCFIHDYSVSVHYKQNTKPAKKIQKRFPFNFCCASCLNARQLPQDSLVNCQYVFFFFALLQNSLAKWQPFFALLQDSLPKLQPFFTLLQDSLAKLQPFLRYCKIGKWQVSFVLLQDSLAKLQPFCATARQPS